MTKLLRLRKQLRSQSEKKKKLVTRKLQNIKKFEADEVVTKQ